MQGKIISKVIETDEDDGNPRWSPDGKKLLYSTHSKTTGYRIWVKNLHTSKTFFVDNGLTPAWSPRVHTVVYAKYVDGNCDIYAKNLDTGTATRLTSHSARDQYPHWGVIDESEKIVFASKRTGYYEIWIMNPNGSGKNRLTDIGQRTGNRMIGPVISPDGLAITFWEIDYKNDHSVWVMASDGTSLVELVKHAANPQWSSVSSDIIYFDSKITGWAQIWKTKIPRSYFRQMAMNQFAEYLESLPPDKRLQEQGMWTRRHLATFELSVSQLKQAFHDLGYFDGEISDDFDDELAKSIISFQQAEKLVPVDGIFGPYTYRKLAARMGW